MPLPLPKDKLLKLQYLLLAVLLAAIWNPAYANNRQADSLHNIYRNSSSKDLQFKALEKLARLYTSYLPDSSLFYGNKALRFAKSNNNAQQQVEAHIIISEAFFSKRLIDSCRSHYQQAIVVGVKNNSFDGQSTAYRRLADFYEQIGKRDSALICLMKAFRLSEKSGNKIEIASCLNSIGTFYKRQGNTEKALDYSLRSLKLWKKIDNLNTGGILSDIGNIYLHQHNAAKALEYYHAAFNIINQNNDPLGRGYTLGNLGIVFLIQKNYPEALNYFLRSLRNYEIAMNKEGLANINAHISRIYTELGKYPDAIQYGGNALAISKEINNKYLIAKCYSVLSDAYQKAGDYKKAYNSLHFFTVYTDSVQNADMSQKVAEMQARYEITGKEAENKALRAEKGRQEVLLQRQEHWAVFITIVLGMVVVISVLILRTSRIRKMSLTKLQEQNKTIETKNLELAALNVKILSQKKQLEESGQFKDRLLSIVSHDFRSPLNSLQGFLMILNDDDLPKPTIKAISQGLLEKVKTTSSFLDNLLSWAHSQLQGYHPSYHKLNLQKSAEDIIALFKTQAEAKGIQVQNNIIDCCEVSADHDMVKLVLRNLISNAIKYTSAGGTVTISCKKEEGAEIITVKDTGTGISPEDQEKLFTQQGFSTKGTANEKGTGLGLMLSKEFIERNGGEIWVKSTPGKGSAFSFSIPSVLQTEQKPDHSLFGLSK